MILSSTIQSLLLSQLLGFTLIIISKEREFSINMIIRFLMMSNSSSSMGSISVEVLVADLNCQHWPLSRCIDIKVTKQWSSGINSRSISHYIRGIIPRLTTSTWSSSIRTSRYTHIKSNNSKELRTLKKGITITRLSPIRWARVAWTFRISLESNHNSILKSYRLTSILRQWIWPLIWTWWKRKIKFEKYRWAPIQRKYHCHNVIKFLTRLKVSS